jgi:hypothetical protein
MTPQLITTIDVKELTKLELRCECGAAVQLTIPPKSGELIAEQKCPGCARLLWEGVADPTRRKLQNLLGAIESWKDAGNRALAVSFVLSDADAK